MECYVNTINEFKLNADTLYSEQLIYADFVKLVNDPAARYDSEFLSNAISNISLQLQRLNDSSAYPMLSERLGAGRILSSEYADFLIASGTTVTQVEYILRVYDPLIGIDIATAEYLKKLDTYYTQNFASEGTGGFCSIFTGLLNSLFSIFGKIAGLIDAISQFKSIEQLLHKLIDTIKDRLLGLLQGLIGQIASCSSAVIAASHKVRKVAEFFNDVNIQTIKDRVTDVISSIGSKFQDLIQKPETIQYLIYRMCQLASSIEQFMRAPLQGLKNLASNCFTSRNSIAYNSAGQTLKAVEAGAFRLSPDAIDSTRARVGGKLNDSATGAPSNGSTVGQGRYFTLPVTEEERSMALGIKGATKDQLASYSYPGSQYIRFQSQVLSQPYEPYPAAGAKELHVDLLVRAIRVARNLGTTLVINSGYRNPRYNAELDGSAKASFHMSGLALDCSKSTFGTSDADADRFIREASRQGFTGIGTYNSFIHIDIRTSGRNIWSAASGSARRMETLAIHQRDGFREGTPTQPTTAI